MFELIVLVLLGLIAYKLYSGSKTGGKKGFVKKAKDFLNNLEKEENGHSNSH